MRHAHHIALYERAALGGSAVAFAIIISLGSRDNDLDLSLRIAIGLAFFAMPVLLAAWISKEQVWPSDPSSKQMSESFLDGFVAAAVFAAFSLLIALAAIFAHIVGWLAAMEGLLWLAVWVLAVIPKSVKESDVLQ